MTDTPNNITKLVSCLVGPAQALENAFQQLLTQRTLDNATGVNLDVIGKIVGQKRGGLDDDTYRRYCRARIAAHRSRGVPESLIRVATLVLGVSTPGTLRFQYLGNATIVLEVRDVIVDSAVAKALQDLLTAATSAGVRLIIMYSGVPLANTARLDTPGTLDSNSLARAIDYRSTTP